jgi:hypothetical protein
MKFSGILNVQLCPNLLLSYTVNFRRLQNVEQAFNHHRFDHEKILYICRHPNYEVLCSVSRL